MKARLQTLWVALCVVLPLSISAQNAAKTDAKKDPAQESSTYSGLKFRSIGPATTSGRVVDIAVNPQNINEYYVAAAAGGVWKTTNRGISYQPIFDEQGSFSIGCITLDPNNPNVVWVGSGENNNQRVVGYGDGIYKSEDGGKTWKNMGLKASEHIGMIAVNPKNSDEVFVAVYGPVWAAGGERGIYKTTDGGKTWKQVLNISQYTGCNEVLIDSRNPNIIYAAAHQRMRHVFTYVSGGPESAIYKSTDGGTTWNKLTNGIPSVELGRIGLAMSPVNPDVLYAVIEAQDRKGGVFRSTDRGASWTKMNDFSTSGNYYQEIFCDPKNVDKIYITDMFFMTSDDGGKTMKRVGEMWKHVDNHVIWINPNDTNHYIVGCDGGIYESYDKGKSWHFKENLPITQFYKVTTDNDLPFYSVHGGTQDNFSLGGPSRTTSANGVANAEWYVTSVGDGFESAVDWKDPNVIYAQSQYGGLVRYDRKSGESVSIKPVERDGEAAYRFNWDSPVFVSQYSNTRVYFAGNKVFRSDDRGDTWQVISPDLTRQLDRNKLPIMGRVQSMDAVAKNASTDIYGNITTIAESKFDENLLWAGTDDGLIQFTTDGGKTWTKVDNIAGVPERTYVNQIVASLHDKNVVYACFNHHRYGDFKPYVFKSTDGGKTWAAITGNLPERGTSYTIAEDHVNRDLLFVGTEFGLFFTAEGGKTWTQLKAGLPTIAVKDLDIQRRENDLVIATFGRGFYILDDYTPLRSIKKEDVINKNAHIFPVKDALMFVESMPLGVRGKGHLGESHFASPNPQVGAVFTYYLKEDLKTAKDKRRDMEKEKIKKGENVYYPSVDTMRLEDIQPEPYLLFTITDESGEVVRRLKAPAKKGVQRIVWDFRYAATAPAGSIGTLDPENMFSSLETGYLAMPGTYKVALHQFVDGVYTSLVPPQSFKCVALNNNTLAAKDKKEYDVFCKKVTDLRRALGGVNQYMGDINNRLRLIKLAVIDAPKVSLETHNQIYQLEKRMTDISRLLIGDATLARREFETPPSVNGRVGDIQGALWTSTAAPSNAQKASFDIASKQTSQIISDLKSVKETLKSIESALEKAEAPYTPGREIEWKN
ncbi:MAG: glycosyl hydrolase [Saprospiraceae bacterium]|nr:glycosyl hydrolase [Saprospiraceae bacterium]